MNTNTNQVPRWRAIHENMQLKKEMELLDL